MLLLLKVVVVAVQVLLVLFHKRHLNMDIAISASTKFHIAGYLNFRVF